MFVVLAAVLQAVAGPLDPQTIPMIGADSYLLARRPSSADIVAARPAAPGATRNGRVLLQCAVAADRGLERCTVSLEEPSGFGYAAAALSLAPKYGLRLDPLPNGQPSPSAVQLWIGFPLSQRPLTVPPSPGPELKASEVAWLRLPTGDQVAREYPERALRLEREGLVNARCAVDADGSLRACTVLKSWPEGFGFEEATFRVLGSFQAPSTTKAGEPMAGRTVLMQVRYVLASEAAKPPQPPKRPAS